MNESPMTAARGKDLAAYLLAVGLCLLFLVWSLQLWRADLRVPLTYYGEAKFNALLVKGILDFGWHVSNPAMNAPEGLDLRDVPMSDNNFLLLLLKLLGVVSHNYGVVLNLSFLLTFPLVTITALYTLRQFGVSRVVAILASLLYTFLPFHFVRGQHHLFLAAYFLVPLMVLVVLWLATGKLTLVDANTGKFSVKLRDHKLLGSVAICLLMSGGGTYFAYFGCFFLLLVGCLVAIQRQNWRCLALPVALVALIFGGLVANLLPSILYLRQQGDTPSVRRHAIDAEIYAMRLSQLILPVSGHRVFLAAKLKAAFNQRLLINENDDASLGAVGTLGFLLLLGWVIVRKPELRRIEDDGSQGVISYLSILNLSAVLLATFGSFSALIALILTPKIRAYNRISIYIAFFALLTVALLLDQLARRYVTNAARHGVFVALLALVLVLGVLDQTSARFVPDYPKIKSEFDSDQKFMRQVQGTMPVGAAIFQLPIVPFPENPKVGKMFDYDHARGYLLTQGLRWSYGAMKGRASEVWQTLLSKKPTPEMIEQIVLSGFQGLYLNRNGYNDAKVENELIGVLGAPQFVSDDGKLIFFDLRNLEGQLRAKFGGAWDAKHEDALHPLLLVWAEGCSEPEGPPDNNFRWCSAIGELQVTNGAAHPRQVRLETSVITENDANLWISGPLLTEHLQTGQKPTPLTRTLTVPPGTHAIHFRSDGQRVLAPGDFRYLVFRLNNFKMTVEN